MRAYARSTLLVPNRKSSKIRPNFAAYTGFYFIKTATPMDLLLQIDRLRLSLLKRLGLKKDSKSRERWLAKGYDHRPEVTVIIESHNKSRQVVHLVGKLRRRPRTEIIVVDDGSTRDHTRRLVRCLTRANEFLIRANDLYENIMYDRTLRMANADYVALLQDDDDFSDTDWIDRALAHLRDDPRLCILGGCDALDICFEDGRGFGRRLEPDGRAVRPCMAVNRAPMWINRTLFLDRLQHIAPEFAPFQYDDYELCARAWLAGLHVAWYDAGFRSLSAGGMRLWNRLFTRQQCAVNGARLYELYAHRGGEIIRLMNDA